MYFSEVQGVKVMKTRAALQEHFIFLTPFSHTRRAQEPNKSGKKNWSYFLYGECLND